MSLPEYESLPFKTARVELKDAVAIVTLIRSKQRNMFVDDMLNELVHVFGLLDKDDRVRVVILTAEPDAPAFCAGADISGGWGSLWKEESEKEGEHAHRDSGGIMTMAIFRCRKITIAAVNGHSAGVGVTGLQLPFDFRFAWSGAKITLPFVRRGIAPEATASYLLPKLIGHSRALAVFLSGATLSTDSPLLSGLYHTLLPNREEVFPAAYAFAKELAANTSQTAIAYTKALVWHAADSIEEQHILDSRAIRTLGAASDGAEGARAFKERRPVKFTDTLSNNMPTWIPWWREIDTKHRKAKL